MTLPPSTREHAAEIARRNVRTVRELEALAVADSSFADRAASFVARLCGSIWFVIAHALLFGGWIAFNLLPGLPRFDPFPFTLLTEATRLDSLAREIGQTQQADDAPRAAARGNAPR